MTSHTGTGPCQATHDPALPELILEALEIHPSGISEYELIQWIKKRGHRAFQDIAFWNRLSLFETHFVLFHTLYQLKDRLWRQNRGTLEINVLNIVLLPQRTSTSGSLADHDPLRDYYLDLDNLANTTDADIRELLATFWQRISRHDKRAAALAELGLCDPVDDVAIKKQHRRLVMQHHPDRGGNKEKLQAINAAMELLRDIKSS